MRRFLGPSTFVLLAGAATLVLALVTGSTSKAHDGASREDAPFAAHGLGAPPPELSAEARAFEDETRVVPLFAGGNFRMPLVNGPLEGERLPEPVARRALAVVRRELRRYRPERLVAVGLRRVVLAADLRENGKLVSSLPNVAGALILDGAVPEAFLVRLVHHEVFHFFDFADPERRAENERWHGEHHLFAYGEGGRSVRAASAGDVTREHPGFLTRYAMSAVEEDKAEVFSLLMTKPELVRERADADAVVGAKVGHLRGKLRRLAPEL